MAEWKVWTKSNGQVALLYRNLQTGNTHLCGALESTVERHSIIQWLMTKGEAQPGDRITFDTGEVLFIAFKPAEA